MYTVFLFGVRGKWHGSQGKRENGHNSSIDDANN
jgi:hypothetical protein